MAFASIDRFAFFPLAACVCPFSPGLAAVPVVDEITTSLPPSNICEACNSCIFDPSRYGHWRSGGLGMSLYSNRKPCKQSPLDQCFPPEMFHELQQTRLITNEQEFFLSLRVLGEGTFHQLGLREFDLRERASTFSFVTSSGEAVLLDLHFFSSSQLSSPNLVLYGRFVSRTGNLLGIFASTIFRDEDGKQGSEIVVVEKDMRRNDLGGFGRAFMHFYNSFNRQFHLDYEYIRAAWLGRKVWTQLGDFQFYPLYSFLVDGKPMSQKDLVAMNFERFLTHHNIKEEDVRFKTKDGSISFSEAKENNRIQKPADYLRLVDRQGRKIGVPPLVDYQVLGKERPFDIGEAFVLSDNRPYKDQKISVQFVKSGVPLESGATWPPNNHFSDRAMPAWVGVRELLDEGF